MTKSPLRLLTLGAAALALALVAPGGRVAAQASGSQYKFLTSADRLQRLVSAINNKGSYVPGELLVKFRDGSAPTDQTRALSVLRRVNTTQSRWIGDVLLVSAAGESDMKAAATQLATQPEVQWAQPNYLRRMRATPNDPQYSAQWNFAALDMPRAWDINPGATSSVKVAVIDTGVTAVTTSFTFKLWTGSQFENVTIPYRANPDISGARILAGRDFVFWDGPVLDMQGHGSHVAGTVLQETNNNLGPAGMAYNATLLPLKACYSYWDIQILLADANMPGFVDPSLDGVCDDGAIADAMRYAADQGAQVINLSVGSSDTSPTIQAAMQYAINHGAFISIAGGNEFLDGNPVEYPAAYANQMDGAVSVGAVGRSLKRSYFSNTGSWIELAAPGGDDRDGGASGMIWQVTLLPDDNDPTTVIRPRFDRYATVAYEGTSMAAPHAAGAAALLYSQGITNPGAVEAALKQFATDLGTKGRDDEFGFGLIAPRTALRGLGLAK